MTVCIIFTDGDLKAFQATYVHMQNGGTIYISLTDKTTFTIDTAEIFQMSIDGEVVYQEGDNE